MLAFDLGTSKKNQALTSKQGTSKKSKEIISELFKKIKDRFLIIYRNVSEVQTKANYFCAFFCVCSFIAYKKDYKIINNIKP